MDDDAARRILALEGTVRSLGNRLLELQTKVREAGDKSMRASHDSIDTKELVYETVLALKEENRKLFELERLNRKREVKRLLKTSHRGNGQLAAWGAGISVVVIVAGLVAAKIIDAVAFAPTVIALLGAVAAVVYRENQASKKEREDDEREERDSGSIHPGDLQRETLPALREPPRALGTRLPRQP